MGTAFSLFYQTPMEEEDGFVVTDEVLAEFFHRRLIKALAEGAYLDPCPNPNCKRIGKTWKMLDGCGHFLCTDCFLKYFSRTHREKTLKQGITSKFLIECPFCRTLSKV